MAEKGARASEGILHQRSSGLLASSKKNHNKERSDHVRKAKKEYQVEFYNSTVPKSGYARTLRPRTYLQDENQEETSFDNTTNNDP
jgi:hypothetical protein